MSADVTNIVAAVAQAVTAQAASHGLPFIPDSLAGDVVADVTNKLSALPADRRRSLSPSDNRLGAIVTASLGAALSKLSDPQRQALKLGLDPFNALIIASLVMAAGAPERHAGRRAHAGSGADDGSLRESSSRRFSALRDRDEARSEEARQFAGLGFSASTIDAFGAIGLNRDLFEKLRRDGFTSLQIAQSARDAQALGFRGEHEITIAQRAPSDLRAAAAAIANAKTPEERAAMQRQYDKMIEQYQRLPDDDPRKADVTAFVHLAKESLAESRHNIGDRAALTMSDTPTASAVADSDQHSRKMMGNQDRAARGKPVAAAATQADDDFGVAVKANPPGRSPPARGPQAGG